MAKSKPIRVFWSGLSQRFYATRAYREVAPGVVEVTGEKFDVTDDIGAIIERYQVQFKPAPYPPLSGSGMSGAKEPDFKERIITQDGEVTWVRSGKVQEPKVEEGEKESGV